jgi:hypothetical protein
MFDDINLSERERDGDAVILDLFHQWQATLKDVDDTLCDVAIGSVEEKAFEAKAEVLQEIQRRLAGTAASGGSGLAIKGFLAAFMAGSMTNFC